MSKKQYNHVLMGDSVRGDMVVTYNGDDIQIKELFGDVSYSSGSKEYCILHGLVRSYNPETMMDEMRPVESIMRHKCGKRMFRIECGSSYVIVTEDHSLMILDDGLVERSPLDVAIGDTMVMHKNGAGPVKITNIIDEGETSGYVYDLTVEKFNTFFANDLLVHNTDSTYVRLDKYADRVGIEKTPENMIALADGLQSVLQDRLPDILAKKFLTPADDIRILEPGREVVGSRGLFKNAKKRYAIHIIDDEGKSVDKLKVMGMETRRSDTPKYIQDFLTMVLEKVVRDGADYDSIEKIVSEFRETFRNMDPWRIGSPGRVKNLNTKTMEIKRWEYASDIIGNKKPQLHITVSASMNTNTLMDMHNETRWQRLMDGDKVEVIYLKENEWNMKAVAIPTGATYVPEWFKKLPFDVDTMEAKLLDKKLFNVIGEVMNWSFEPSTSYADEISQTIEDFYD